VNKDPTNPDVQHCFALIHTKRRAT